MLIKKLTLTGYRRLMLGNINRISITPQSAIQIILGTNGSGKSSILQELSPLPADPKDYVKGGSKVIEIEHNGSHYLLTSEFNGKNTHSFIKDGSELNDGGTITVQRELVLREFDYDETIQDILLGRKRFTRMSPKERRDIISRMSDNDMTYAFRLHKELATRARDGQGAVKSIKEKIAKETDKLLAMEVHTDLEELVQTLQNELTVLMENRQNGLPSTADVERKLQRLLNEAEALARDVLEHPFQLPEDTRCTSLEELSEQIVQLQMKEAGKRSELGVHASNYDKLQRLVGNVESADVQSVEQLYERRQMLIERQEQVGTIGRGMFEFTGDMSDMLEQAQNFKVQMVEALSELPDNSEGRYSRAVLQEVNQTLERLRIEQARVQSVIGTTRHQISHMEQAQETHCPKCGYMWKPGVSEQELKHKRDELLGFEARLKELGQQYEKAYELREAILSYSAQYTRLTSIGHAYPKAKNFFDWLLDDKRVLHNPSNHIPMLDQWVRDLMQHQELWQLQREFEVVNRAIEAAETLSESGVGHAMENLKDLEEQIGWLNTEIRKLQGQIKQLQALRDRAQLNEQHGKRLNQLMAEIAAEHTLLTSCLRSDILGRLIREHQSTLAMNVQKLNEKKAVENLIGDLQRFLVDAEEAQEVDKLLARALSPTEGIIAQQLSAFISYICEQMNEVIAQIYTYRLQILPCGMGNGELTYRFPVLIGDEDEPTADVALTSMGQSEIIDFAFLLVAMVYLGMQDSPLIADELGSNQDETHMTNLMQYVKMLIDSHRHPQLFMVSHFAAFHSSFTNADVLVLNAANITVPNRHNHHVEID